MKDINGLEPCPFCGANGVYLMIVPAYTVVMEQQAYVYCKNCLARGPTAFYGEDRSLAETRAPIKWNRREP